MLRITAVGRVERLETRGEDAYLYVSSSFWNTDTGSRDSATLIFRVASNKFTNSLVGRTVYVEGTDIRVVNSGDNVGSLVIVMQARVESA
jgi:hypothetical protein